MSLNEVNWRNVFTDHKSFPPDVEFLVTEGTETKVLQQKFFCHKLLLATVSPVFQEQFFGANRSAGSGDSRMVIRIPNCNPAAFQKMLEYIYYQKPYKLNSLRNVEEGTEGIKLVMDTMDLALRFKLKKLVSFCEETADKTVVVNHQNYLEVQQLMMNHKELGMIHESLCEKFGSLVLTRLSRERPHLDSHEKRFIIESEITRFRRGLPSDLMCTKRPLSSDNFVSSSNSSLLISPSKTPRSDVDENLQEAPNNDAIGPNKNHEVRNLTPLSGGSSGTKTSSTTSSTCFVSLLGPFPSPVPTSSTQLEQCSSPDPDSSGFFSSQDQVPSRASSLTLSDLWEPRSTSTPVPYEEGGLPVESVQVSTQMLRNILKTVEGGPIIDETKDEIFTKDELVTLVSRFKDLCGEEKQELFEYMKLLEVKNPELVKNVREEVLNLR